MNFTLLSVHHLPSQQLFQARCIFFFTYSGISIWSMLAANDGSCVGVSCCLIQSKKCWFYTSLQEACTWRVSLTTISKVFNQLSFISNKLKLLSRKGLLVGRSQYDFTGKPVTEAYKHSNNNTRKPRHELVDSIFEMSIVAVK